MMIPRLIPLLGLLSLTACMAPVADAPATRAQGSADGLLGPVAPADDGACFAVTAGPTETVVVNELIEVAPAVFNDAGAEVSPPVFRNVARPETKTLGDGERFETVCADLLTPVFVSTLQRALITRRAYSGPVSGTYDTETALAVQQFQRDAGIDSPDLAVSTARQLGVLAVARDQL